MKSNPCLYMNFFIKRSCLDKALFELNKNDAFCWKGFENDKSFF